MLSQYFAKSKQYLKQFQQKPSRRQALIKQLIESPRFQSWFYLDEIIEVNVQESQDSGLARLVKELIQDGFNNIKSFTMLIYLHNLQIQNRISLQFIPWATIYSQLCIKDNELIIFNSWAFNPQTYEKEFDFIQSTLQMIGKHFAQFLRKNKIPFTDLQFDSIIQWVSRMKTQNQQKFEISIKLTSIIKQINIVKHQLDYVSKQHLVIKKIIENIGDKISNSGNVFILLQPQKYYTQKEINYFCHIYYQYLNSLNQQYLCNVFTNLIAGGATKVALIIIDKISSLLVNNQDYFKLRIIYQNFILPIMTKYKAHTELAQEVFNIIELYAIGFLKHCHIGQTGLEYLLENVQNIQKSDLKQKWVKMILAVSFANQLQTEAREQLNLKKGVQNKLVNNQIDGQLVDQSKIWDVTLRTGKKLKKYNKVLCDFKGIQNKANECYIISVVQALFFTKQLQNLIEQHRDYIKGNNTFLPLLDQFRILFSELDGRRKAEKIVITYLKRQGPQYFRARNHQEDAQQYLILLFASLEQECNKVPSMKAKLKKIFEINCEHKTKCLSCNAECSNIENQYIHTIPHTKLLQLKVQQEQLEDYVCQQCKKIGHCKNTRIISPKSKIFIVHINRFSFTKEGKCLKQLSNQTILRKFLSYELVGMICHIGKNIDSGHYIYFAKLGSKLWVEMNDRLAYKFEIDDQEEQFQREMKSDMTPYILFYKKME